MLYVRRDPRNPDFGRRHYLLDERADTKMNVLCACTGQYVVFI